MNRYCVIGEKLPHTMSPQIHSMFFESMGIKGEYGVREFSREEILNARAELEKYDGVNVTVPYKQTVMPLLDEISKEAEHIGAVNTIKNTGGRLAGYKSVLYALTSMGADVKYVRRDVDEELEGYEYITYPKLEQSGSGYIIVNTTPLGMYPKVEGCAVSEEVFSRFEVAADVVYNPVMTEFVRRALNAGCHAFSGLYMLVAQGIGSQSIWRNEEIQTQDIDPIYNALLRDYFMQNGGNIYLTGIMSCGKSTLGKMLAESTGKKFVDADEYVVEIAGESIPDMFAKGEEYFRERETQAMKQLAQMRDLVVAAGGGAVTRRINCDLMRSSGVVVYINRSVESIIKDVDCSQRPLLAEGAEKLRSIFAARKSMYEGCAHFIVDNNGTAEQGLKKIAEILQ